MYVVDGLFDVSNAEFGGRASVGLANGEACGLEDGINHGLFVAGLVAGRRTGVAKQAKIVSVGSSYGCEGGDGDATEAQAIARIVRAIDWVAKNARKPAVVNLSLNLDAPAPEITAAVKRLIEAGLTVVASAGNDGEDACQHPPAGLPSVITVTASTKADKDAGLNHGRCVDLFAPARGRHLGGGSRSQPEPPGHQRGRRDVLGGAPGQRCGRAVPVRPPDGLPRRGTRLAARQRHARGHCEETCTGHRTGCCSPEDRCDPGAGHQAVPAGSAPTARGATQDL